MHRLLAIFSSLLCLTFAAPGGARAAADVANDADVAAELAQKLSNPISSLISVPFQYNWDTGFGPDDEDRQVLNIQPVVPISIAQDWNLISRTILPVIHQENVPPRSGTAFGLGDMVQSLFFSPKEPTAGFVWGVGPVLLFPTATHGLLGGDEWGAGPTAVVLRQDGAVTWGALLNHVWSYAGYGKEVSATFLQPFVSYNTKTATTFFLNTESTYDWKGTQWSVPINAGVNQLVKLGEQRIQLGVGARYWADAPSGGPDWGLRLNFVLLFPR